MAGSGSFHYQFGVPGMGRGLGAEGARVGHLAPSSIHQGHAHYLFQTMLELVEDMVESISSFTQFKHRLSEFIEAYKEFRALDSIRDLSRDTNDLIDKLSASMSGNFESAQSRHSRQTLLTLLRSQLHNIEEKNHAYMYQLKYSGSETGHNPAPLALRPVLGDASRHGSSTQMVPTATGPQAPPLHIYHQPYQPPYLPEAPYVLPGAEDSPWDRPAGGYNPNRASTASGMIAFDQPPPIPPVPDVFVRAPPSGSHRTHQRTPSGTQIFGTPSGTRINRPVSHIYESIRDPGEENPYQAMVPSGFTRYDPRNSPPQYQAMNPRVRTSPSRSMPMSDTSDYQGLPIPPGGLSRSGSRMNNASRSPSPSRSRTSADPGSPASKRFYFF